MEFSLYGKRYLVTGWLNEDGTYTISLCSIEETPAELFTCTAKLRSDVLETFENAKIFGDKNIYDVEKDIVVMYG